MSEHTRRSDVIAILSQLSQGTALEALKVGSKTLRPIDVTNAIHDALELVNLQVDVATVPDLPHADRDTTTAETLILQFNASQAQEQNMVELQRVLRAAAPAVEDLARTALARLLGPESARCRPVASLLAFLSVAAFGMLAVAAPLAGWSLFGGLFLSAIGLDIWIQERKKRPADLDPPEVSPSVGRQAARTVEWWVGKSLVERVEEEGVTTLLMLFVTGLLILLRWLFEWGVVAVWVVAAIYAAFLLSSIWTFGRALCTTRRFMTSPLYSTLDLRISRIVMHGGEDLSSQLGGLLVVYVIAKFTLLLWLASHL